MALRETTPKKRLLFYLGIALGLGGVVFGKLLADQDGLWIIVGLGISIIGMGLTMRNRPY